MGKKLDKFLMDPKQALKNFGIFIGMIFVVVYACFQILPTFSEKLETETALKVTVFDANATTGYIFRNEEPVTSTGSNDRVVVTLIKDGERVSRGQHFANAYTTEDYADIQEQIDVIDDKISVLERSSVSTNAYVTDLSKTDGEINDGFTKIYSAVSDGELGKVNSVENDLLVNMNKRNLIINMSDGYKSELDSLKAQKSNLESKISVYSDKITASVSGYFYGDTDGFERIFNVDLLDSLTHDDFRQIVESEPEQHIAASNYGKIVKDFVWYVVCESDKTAAAKYVENRKYNLVFPSYSDDELGFVLDRIVKSTSEDTVLLVFRCNTAPDGFSYSRSQQVNIISSRHSGYAVPKEAVRMLGKERGVYILIGDIVRFRRIEILSEDGDYYIVKIPQVTAETEAEDNADDSENKTESKYPYLALYDNVIIGGKNLFDGKIVG